MRQQTRLRTYRCWSMTWFVVPTTHDEASLHMSICWSGRYGWKKASW